MKQYRSRPARAILAVTLIGNLATVFPIPAWARKAVLAPEGGRLDALDVKGNPLGPCPLQHTAVNVEVSGHLARVTVQQRYRNPYADKIEAVYTFPLSHRAAVDRMTMTVGDRVVVGEVRERTQARALYEAARQAGYVASLLEQERPNIFTQSVANIEPAAEVVVEISYVELLQVDEGEYRFDFPMVVGPRYIPGVPTTSTPELPADLTPRPGLIKSMGAGFAPDTGQVPDASRITPQPVKPGLRAGHDISLHVEIDTGGPEIVGLKSALHDITVEAKSPSRATVSLKNTGEIPNRDFVLTWRHRTGGIQEAKFTHTGEHGNFFSLILQPPARVEASAAVPRELVFVLDTSGSMSGFPIEKAKAVMAKAIEALRPHDTFNLITFAGNTRVLWAQPRPNTPANRREAQTFLAGRRGGGGTEMMKAINAALVQTRVDDGPGRPIRIVCFMTDGYVGNDMGIIAAVRKNAGTTRVFSFGIGNSVNRFLLDGMARAGRGEVEYVLLNDAADEKVERFARRIQTPVLTDIELTFSDGLKVVDMVPGRIPDLFDVQPLVLHGRYTSPGRGTLTIRGNTGAGRFERVVPIELPESQPKHDTIATLWARAKVEEIMNQDLAAAQRGRFPAALEKEVIRLGETFRIMTRFTSFVAVEKARVTIGGQPRLVAVPIEMPQGVSYEGIFGRDVLPVGDGDGVDDLVTALTSATAAGATGARVPEDRSVEQLSRLEMADVSVAGEIARFGRAPGSVPLNTAAVGHGADGGHTLTLRQVMAAAPMVSAQPRTAMPKLRRAAGRRGRSLQRKESPRRMAARMNRFALDTVDQAEGGQLAERLTTPSASGPAEQARAVCFRARIALRIAALVADDKIAEARKLAEALAAYDGAYVIGARMRDVLVREKLGPAERDRRIVALAEEAKTAMDAAIRAARLKLRLDARLYLLATAVRGPWVPSAVTLKDGRVVVSVLVRNVDERTLGALRKAGLRIQATAASMNLIVGAVTREKLADVALLDGVRKVDPTDGV